MSGGGHSLVSARGTAAFGAAGGLDRAFIGALPAPLPAVDWINTNRILSA
jgi:hypothetical protein